MYFIGLLGYWALVVNLDISAKADQAVIRFVIFTFDRNWDMDVPTDSPSQPLESGTSLTEEEAIRYDRQMRLWGIEAQQR